MRKLVSTGMSLPQHEHLTSSPQSTSTTRPSVTVLTGLGRQEVRPEPGQASSAGEPAGDAGPAAGLPGHEHDAAAFSGAGRP